MKITRAEASTHRQGYAILSLTIDGHAGYVAEPKATLLDAGIAVLLDADRYWEESVCEIFEGDDGARELRGASRDPELIGLVRRFIAGERGNLLDSR